MALPAGARKVAVPAIDRCPYQLPLSLMFCDLLRGHEGCHRVRVMDGARAKWANVRWDHEDGSQISLFESQEPGNG